MRIGDEVYIHGYIDEIRQDTIIIHNEGGYFGTIPNEIKYNDIIKCFECKNCKKKRGTFKGEPIIFYRCTENNRDVESDGFCSWGERCSE